MECISFNKDFPLGNQLLFLAFLEQVITENRNNLIERKKSTLGILKIITNAAGECMGLPVDVEQLKTRQPNGSSPHSMELQINVYKIAACETIFFPRTLHTVSIIVLMNSQ